MPSDGMTKVLPYDAHLRFLKMLGLTDIEALISKKGLHEASTQN
jgi:hypothetical protein